MAGDAPKKKADDPGGNDDKYAEFNVYIDDKPYRAVGGRIKEWRDELKAAGKAGEVIVKEAFWESDGVLVCQVRCYCPLNGYAEATAAAYGKSSVDRSNPYENAETSAWGRLLGLWGYGLLGWGIASAEEVAGAKGRQAKTTHLPEEAARKRAMVLLAEMSVDPHGEEVELPDGRKLRINRDRFSDLLERATEFTGQDGETVAGKRDLKRVSERAIGPTVGRLEKMYAEWREPTDAEYGEYADLLPEI